MIKRLAHVCFLVTDVKRSLDFYTRKMGMEHAFDLPGGAYVRAGNGTFIEFFKGSLPSVPVAQGIKDSIPVIRHFCLEVDDIQAEVKKLKKKKVNVSEITMGKDNSWQAWITDPDGYHFELHQYTKTSLQKKK